MTRRVPFQVTEADRSLTVRLYGAVGDVNWIQYGAADSLVRRAAGPRTAARGHALPRAGPQSLGLLRPLGAGRSHPRHPPPARARSGRLAEGPRSSRSIRAIPPAGTTGPTGLREAEANLAIGLEVKRLLEEQGARVFMTRTADVPLELWPRVDMAERAGAEVLVSIHNNALPDGVNPLTNNGSSVYYNHPRSIAARPRDPGAAGPPPRRPRPRRRARRPGAGAHHLDALRADRGPVRHRPRAGGRPALATRRSASTPRP